MQHGTSECLLNAIEACAIKVWPDVVTYLFLFLIFFSSYLSFFYIKQVPNILFFFFNLTVVKVFSREISNKYKRNMALIKYISTFQNSTMQKQHFPFIRCVEKSVEAREVNGWRSCFQATGLSSEAIVNCYNSGYGQQVCLTPLVYTVYCTSISKRLRTKLR